MATEKEHRPISSLFSDLINDLTKLFRQEILLAKTEISEKVGQATSGGISMIAGGAVIFAGFLVILNGAVLALANIWAPWLSALIVGGVVVVIGALFLSKGRSNFKAKNLAPRRTTESLRRDKELVRDYVGSR